MKICFKPILNWFLVKNSKNRKKTWIRFKRLYLIGVSEFSYLFRISMVIGQKLVRRKSSMKVFSYQGMIRRLNMDSQFSSIRVNLRTRAGTLWIKLTLVLNQALRILRVSLMNWHCLVIRYTNKLIQGIYKHLIF